MDLLRSLPLGLYLEYPRTWLHRLDPRIKLIWLLTFLVAPLLANPIWRLSLVGLLIALTILAGIPWRVWRQQMGWLLFLSFFIFTLTSLMPDGLKAAHQPRLPSDELAFAQQPASLPTPTPAKPWYNPFGDSRSVAPTSQTSAQPPLPQPTDYRYVLVRQPPITITRRSLDLGIRVSTLLFTLIYSTNLFLLTTAPEEITAAIESFLSPLRRLGLPVTEITLTLTLALRFIPVVLEEIQNLVRSVSTRAINWRKLGLRKAAQVWLMVLERLIQNLLLRAEQIASAMGVRGFTSPNQHRVEWYQFRWHRLDWAAIAALLLFWCARFLWGNAA
jgi:energy-coupling factor transport system permease protein